MAGAAFRVVKSRYLPSCIENGKALAERYRTALSDISDLLLPHYDDPRRDHIYQNLEESMRRPFPIVNEQDSDGGALSNARPLGAAGTQRYRARVVGGAVSEYLFERGLCLPSSTQMTEHDLERIVGTIRGAHAR